VKLTIHQYAFVAVIGTSLLLYLAYTSLGISHVFEGSLACASDGHLRVKQLISKHKVNETIRNSLKFHSVRYFSSVLGNVFPTRAAGNC